MHVGILTGGGDCPGLNAVIRAVTLALVRDGARVTGIERGFLGLCERRSRPLGEAEVSGILAQGGTILGTHNRCDPFHYFGAGGADVSGAAMDYVRELGLSALVAIGGDGTMAISHRLAKLYASAGQEPGAFNPAGRSRRCRSARWRRTEMPPPAPRR